LGRVLDHLGGAHPALAFGEEQVLALVAHAFELERATPHEGARVPDEGLGTEPRWAAARVHPGPRLSLVDHNRYHHFLGHPLLVGFYTHELLLSLCVERESEEGMGRFR
jgi:hypothetical protein